MRLLKLIYPVFILFAAQSVNSQSDPPSTAFYVVAYPDDWQLFMGASALRDILRNVKTVIINITAGDIDGLEPYGVDLCTMDPVPYYRVREVGSHYSVYLVDQPPGYGWHLEPYPTENFVLMNGHCVKKHVYRNTINYFLRLKDEDFQKMYLDHSEPGETIEDSTYYTNWCDLTQTIAAIITAESISGLSRQLNIPDINSFYNPSDRPSHTYAGFAALDAVKFNLGINMLTWLYVCDDSKNRPVNLSDFNLSNEAGMAAAYNMSLINHRISTNWVTSTYDYQAWSGRNYFRAMYSNDIFMEHIPCRIIHPFSSKFSTKEDHDYQLYPNPGNGLFRINFNQPHMENVAVLVYNSLGQLLKQEIIKSSSSEIDITQFGQGQYFVRIIGDDENIVKKAVIVN